MENPRLPGFIQVVLALLAFGTAMLNYKHCDNKEYQKIIDNQEKAYKVQKDSMECLSSKVSVLDSLLDQKNKMIRSLENKIRIENNRTEQIVQKIQEIDLIIQFKK